MTYAHYTTTTQRGAVVRFASTHVGAYPPQLPELPLLQHRPYGGALVFCSLIISRRVFHNRDGA